MGLFKTSDKVFNILAEYYIYIYGDVNKNEENDGNEKNVGAGLKPAPTVKAHDIFVASNLFLDRA